MPIQFEEKMSYCTARRMAATRRVQLLEQTLKEIEGSQEDPRRIQHVREALQNAQAELATIGDCGD